MSAYFASADGLRLAYHDGGPRDGLPVLCLAGLTRNSGDFEYLAAHLAHVRLIAMDYRGRGASDWASDCQSYCIPTEARDVLALLDHLEIARTAIIGTSRGGLIAMTLAALAKERLIGTLLNDVGPVVEADGLTHIQGYLGKRPEFATQAEFAAAKPALMPGFANVPATRWAAEVAHQTIQGCDGLHLTYDPALRTAFLAASAHPAPDLWPFFDGLDGLPLALIRGANSNILSPDTAAEMRRRRPDMGFAEIPDRGHAPFLDEPAALAAINTWISQCRSASEI